MQYHHDFTGVIKSHKPEKNYPMRTIVSTIGKVPCGTSKYLPSRNNTADFKQKHTPCHKFMHICGRS